ncbi:MAG: radical SAM family heme chaperone HemW [Alphaproteobacteria bacterium]|jgi:oxygen-independent coproporphyrinogen-3 oxidase|nr:radical SAM family heme chaperone HemW [Alphaproteobacteria bacterium]
MSLSKKNINTKTGIYIHYPFCLSKCSYCDFNSIANKNIDQDKVLDAFFRDLDYYKSLVGDRQISTIYFGGGTPSLMSPQMVKKIIDYIKEHFSLLDNAEITIEANPLTAEIKKFKAFKTAGINRISIGAQSFSQKGLKALGRTHSVKQTKKALKVAKKVFSRSSFDLIYGWKGQTLADWKKDLKTALKYHNGHISMYQLTIYEGTALYKNGEKEIDEDTSLLFQETAKCILSKQGINQYEISNYSKTSEESRHNLLYWHYDDYIGIGAGASGRLTINGEKKAFINETNIKNWLKENSPDIEILNDKEKAYEYLIMGLRLNKGICLKDFQAKTSIDIKKMIADKNLNDFLKINKGYLFATKKGRDRLNLLLQKLF